MKRFTIFLTMVLSLCLIPAFGQTTIFVSTSGDDANNGATWETAKATLAGALTAATGNTHIYMKVGVYASNDVVIPNGVTVTGGYDTVSASTDTTHRQYPGPNSRWSNANLCTILDAGQTSRVATVNTGGLLEGCVLQNGKVTDLGGGVLIDGGTVMHCVLIYNVALDYDNQTAKGGGAYIRNNGYLLNSVVAKNHANNGPGVAGTDGTLTNNTITANVSVANCGTVSDEDGNIYKTIVIGTQCWMAENLRTTRPTDGPLIPKVSSSVTTSSEPRRLDPMGGESKLYTQGYLYNFAAVVNGDQSITSTSNPSGIQGICPIGWHIPSPAEWTQLTDFVMSQIPYQCSSNGYSYIAKALCATTDWHTSTNSCAVGNNQITNNVSGFNAYENMNIRTGSYSHDYGTEFWTSTYTAIRILCSWSTFSVIDVGSTSYRSVRCVRD